MPRGSMQRAMAKHLRRGGSVSGARMDGVSYGDEDEAAEGGPEHELHVQKDTRATSMPGKAQHLKATHMPGKAQDLKATHMPGKAQNVKSHGG